MPEPVFIQLRTRDGNGVEGAATRYGSDGNKLPEGSWNVSLADGTEKIMVVDEMPAHWIDQLRRWVNFGNRNFGRG